MEGGRVVVNPFSVLLILMVLQGSVRCMNQTEKQQLRDKVVEMFNHAYRNYMQHAFPHDELMPITCQGRSRGTQPSRGDIDDVLGNFSLTLIDSLDSLVVLGQVEDFDDAIRKVISHVTFDTDVVVSVFETNIRVLGGLLGGHVMAENLKRRGMCCSWYSDELLAMATDLGNRLLPAFNTTTGIPYPRVNLRYGVKPGTSRTGHEKDTCTACAGTMILEFAALSRLTGDPIYEFKAHTAMEFLWKQRHRSSDLVGTVINIHNGDWVRRESGVGAGIDSYYEYMLKAYILLGDETYLDRFNKHYESIMRYISQGPMMVDVHMHKPLSNSRNFMDALLAFWPGLQVLKGDLKAAIETHEMLYQVTQRHNFLPEAFTTDFRVHWGQHPLRPEFVESTYFIYKATGDPYYLEVGKTVMENLDKHARVACGFAAIKDVTTGIHEDQMDSYVLAETFKYLYLLFTEREDLIVDIDDYIFTTEAHLLPLSLSIYSTGNNATNATQAEKPTVTPCGETDEEEGTYHRTCPNTQAFYSNSINYAHSLRQPLKNLVERICPKPRERRKPRLRAAHFIAGDKDQLEELKRMGIRIATMKDGRVQLLHTASEAASSEGAEDGMLFMQEMIDLSKQQQQEVQQEPRVVQLLSPPFFGNLVFNAGPAQFGYDLKTREPLHGVVRKAEPYKGCQLMQNAVDLRGRIAVMERGDCMFIDKARNIQAAGAIGGIVIDHNGGTNSETSPLFAMSGDGRDDIFIPMLFLFHHQGERLLSAIDESNGNLYMMMGYQAKPSDQVMKFLLDIRDTARREEGKVQAAGPDTTLGTSPLQAPLPHETKTTAGTSDVEPESDATRLLLNKYMKKMKLGEIEVQIRESRQWNKQAESLLQIIEGPDKGDRHVSVQLDNLVTSETEEKISKVYDELVKLLMSHTNLHSLADRGSYLKALNDLVETAFRRGESGLDSRAQATLDRLAAELRPKTKAEAAETVESTTEQVGEDLIKLVPGDETEERPQNAKHFYLVNNQNKPGEDGEVSRSAVVKKAPEWMGLQDGEVMVDENGIMYVNDGYDFDEDSPSSSLDDLVKAEAAHGSGSSSGREESGSFQARTEDSSSQSQQDLLREDDGFGEQQPIRVKRTRSEDSRQQETAESRESGVAPENTNRDSAGESRKDEL